MNEEQKALILKLLRDSIASWMTNARRLPLSRRGFVRSAREEQRAYLRLKIGNLDSESLIIISRTVEQWIKVEKECIRFNGESWFIGGRRDYLPKLEAALSAIEEMQKPAVLEVIENAQGEVFNSAGQLLRKVWIDRHEGDYRVLAQAYAGGKYLGTYYEKYFSALDAMTCFNRWCGREVA